MPIHNISVDDETADEITVAVLRRAWESNQMDIAQVEKILEQQDLDNPNRPKIEELRQLEELDIYLRGTLGYMTVLDNCEECEGMRGGVKGNENVIDGVVTCDYCHAIEMERKLNLSKS